MNRRNLFKGLLSIAVVPLLPKLSRKSSEKWDGTDIVRRTFAEVEASDKLVRELSAKQHQIINHEEILRMLTNALR